MPAAPHCLPCSSIPHGVGSPVLDTQGLSTYLPTAALWPPRGSRDACTRRSPFPGERLELFELGNPGSWAPGEVGCKLLMDSPLCPMGKLQLQESRAGLLKAWILEQDPYCPGIMSWGLREKLKEHSETGFLSTPWVTYHHR